MFQRWDTDSYMATEQVCSNGGLQIPTWLQKRYTCSNGGLQIPTWLQKRYTCSNGGLQIPTWLQKRYVPSVGYRYIHGYMRRGIHVPTVGYRYLHGHRRGTFHRWVQWRGLWLDCRRCQRCWWLCQTSSSARGPDRDDQRSYMSLRTRRVALLLLHT